MIVVAVTLSSIDRLQHYAYQRALPPPYIGVNSVSGEHHRLLVFDRGLDHGSGNPGSIVQRCRRHWPRWVARGRRLANLGIHPPVISSPPPQDADFSKQGLAILRLVCECRRTIAKMPRQLLILPLHSSMNSISLDGAAARPRGLPAVLHACWRFCCRLSRLPSVSRSLRHAASKSA